MDRTEFGRPELVELRWDRFRVLWRRSEGRQKLALLDGRPALRDVDGALLTVSHPLWDRIKRHLGDSPQKRVRLCEACGGPMQVMREFHWAWTFKCPTCSSLEIHSKPLVGGTVGAGEREPDEQEATWRNPNSAQANASPR